MTKPIPLNDLERQHTEAQAAHRKAQQDLAAAPFNDFDRLMAAREAVTETHTALAAAAKALGEAKRLREARLAQEAQKRAEVAAAKAQRAREKEQAQLDASLQAANDAARTELKRRTAAIVNHVRAIADLVEESDQLLTALRERFEIITATAAERQLAPTVNPLHAGTLRMQVLLEDHARGVRQDVRAVMLRPFDTDHSALNSALKLVGVPGSLADVSDWPAAMQLAALGDSVDTWRTRAAQLGAVRNDQNARSDLLRRWHPDQAARFEQVA